MAQLRTSLRVAQAIDVVLVLVFVLIGRSSHHEAITLPGTLVTLWPFLVGLVAGHLVMRAWRSPLRVWPTGVGIWVATVVVGMLLRVVSGQGIQLGFVIVATIVLGVFLVGWRALAIPIAGRRRRRR
ncbi:DUF3054 domain-containing protein [Galbitalea soli]|uniref:DUF3054 domain-containing protein n=1 Tax=Galbitalea soli TaxID=1268042 RepID=A0A7C9PNG3_9MICO|nr:DUF3054 domain-containing protein [Galbitalea soli]NEM91630.1 DUF3054 domain-containing protein [Galbitalea soli]NYJ30325.1 hypothetical protein [Galbitalea soli]